MNRATRTDTLRHLLQTLAFCLAVAAIQCAVRPEQDYGVALVYSLCIGLLTWASVEWGRHLFPSSASTGWPQGYAAMALPAGGIALGLALGSPLADWLTGRSSWSGGQWRTTIAITVLAGTAATYFFHSRGKSKWLEAQANEARLRLLEAQLEPHMLFNTLANLRVLITLDPPRAVAMLDRLNSYLRATLAGSRATQHPLSAEFDRLADYLELMAMRMGARLRYTLDLPGDLQGAPVPPLLLQPLVENAIRHGLEPQVAGGEIHVSARREGRLLVLEVADTGVGLPQEPGNGFGVQQVRERLHTLHGALGTLDLIAGSAGGTRAVVRFPL
jgi:hypothetical protein